MPVQGSTIEAGQAYTVLEPIEDENTEVALPERTKSKRERFSFVVANPDTLFTLRHKNASDSQLHVQR
jgi:hypothetical protein